MKKHTRWYNVAFSWKKLRANREYKDRLFRFLFRDKEDLLELYNAVRGSNYSDPDELEIITLEDVIFMGMKNDLSFMISSSMVLYEHQSTYSPNLPLRGLFYFARQYEGLVAEKRCNLYGSKLIKLPTPEYVIFYNGVAKQPDRVELYLSDAFGAGRGTGCLECKAVMYNINRGHNEEVLQKCRRLWEYSEFIAEINDYTAKGYSLKNAVVQAMNSCIDRHILTDVLVHNREEVLHMLLTEFDMKQFKKDMYEEGREDGRAEGRDTLLEMLVGKKIAAGKSVEVIAAELEMDIDTTKKIIEKLEND